MFSASFYNHSPPTNKLGEYSKTCVNKLVNQTILPQFTNQGRTKYQNVFLSMYVSSPK